MEPRLSNNDDAVLAALFDPESSLSSTIQINNQPSASLEGHQLRLLQDQERHALQGINHTSPEVSDIELAISRLTAIIDQDSSYASAWNNRAQARRMLLDDRELPANPENVAAIFDDIAQAIILATPGRSTDAISRLDAKVLASAHTHRGYLLLMASKSKADRQMLGAIPKFRALSPEQLEEVASRELALGGRYGNDTARQLAVKTNPYAKLCGCIVREALTKEIADYYQPLDSSGVR